VGEVCSMAASFAEERVMCPWVKSESVLRVSQPPHNPDSFRFPFASITTLTNCQYPRQSIARGQMTINAYLNLEANSEEKSVSSSSPTFPTKLSIGLQSTKLSHEFCCLAALRRHLTSTRPLNAMLVVDGPRLGTSVQTRDSVGSK
jgi:hypothetical protein